MVNKTNKIRKIAYNKYLEYKENGFDNDPFRDWMEAEAIYSNKIKYVCLNIWHFIKINHYAIVAIVAILSPLLTLFTIHWNMKMTLYSKKIDWESTVLNTRPYVSADMKNPQLLMVNNEAFYGNEIILKNSGRIPAAQIETKYYITTDKDKENMNGSEWYNKNLGGFGSTSFIIPQGIESELGKRSLSPSADYYYFEALTIYEGLESNKKYWTHIKKVFYIDKKLNVLLAVFVYGDWDRNKYFEPPLFSTKEEVVKKLEEIANRTKN